MRLTIQLLDVNSIIDDPEAFKVDEACREFRAEPAEQVEHGACAYQGYSYQLGYLLLLAQLIISCII